MHAQGKEPKPAGLDFEAENHIARWETLCEMARLQSIPNEYFKSVGSLELMVPAYTLRTGPQARRAPQDTPRATCHAPSATRHAPPRAMVAAKIDACDPEC